MSLVRTWFPQVDAFRTANWKRIQKEFEEGGILGLFENVSLQNQSVGKLN